MRIDVALATCAMLPEPDTDMAPLLAALRSSGMSAEALPWDAPDADFSAAHVTLLRSTWNYPEHPKEFLAWVGRLAGATRLRNPANAIRWNVHKGYLLDLGARGIPVTPTFLLSRGDRTPLAEVMRERGWREVVVKPAVSAASRDTLRVGPSALERGEAHLRALAARGDVLVQPFLASVEGHGERAIVWIDGAPTHAVRKAPRFSGDAESVSAAVPIADDEATLAQRAVAAAPGPLLYARIDMARSDDGAPVVMELELIEPSLFFPQSPAALDRYTAAVRRIVDDARAAGGSG